ncbi:TPA: HlyD family type I secretion periplasmic adaptor subunit [Vibrio parahaemolyticus]|uniref:HlyD family type I secretion periplasmic adaptor subunit n=1 Tax=Vibrio parahaemolyticus TaxID=670 RepID=UPI0004280B27|nr:HlyD family type I secretion periplasmic adaptor subunit [Vibrio parahaemolyticus]EGQ7777444.1 HlyD family type I secretion periplasmic adaptor subunit [Vibrio parahaemolyticus]EGQ7779686.1 HlyD family type I secretion periplasmic adaptor subunit [Vibrio parahaemolyticus]EGQ7867039.1 HlyD family type I secretion periplasmic adaptor subunit [Vibrio parahaemolyticus]EGQ7882896.1 HlyD family type I secretion periplasmic adaptor subunit [Vibrio parahaemolyticus]EGQ7886564.1 HlyD family type I s
MSRDNYNKLSNDELDFVDDKTAALLLNTPNSARLMLWVMVLFFVAAIGWASWAQIDQVTVGQGKVIPSSQIQVVQNLEGGLVKEILVKEGQLVKKGQQLLLIDDTRFRSDYREREQQVANLTASVLQLSASINSVAVNRDFNIQDWEKSVVLDYGKLTFPPVLEETQPQLTQRQKAEYREDLDNLRNQLSVIDQQVEQKQQDLVEIEARVRNLRQSYQYAKKELDITQPLADEGVVPRIELLKLQRQVNDTRREMTSSELKIPVIKSAIKESMLNRIDVALKFRSEQQEKLNNAQDQLSALVESAVGLEDRVNRTVVVSPVTGKIKTLNINTVGGVIQPGMDIVEIVPTEDTLLVEAKIAPKDIAFLRPNLNAIVKFTAYDFTKYGGLVGELEHISADTTQDEEGNSFYIVRVRTEKTSFGQDADLPIIPGMTASVDIITGKRTVLEYLLKPILSAKTNALKE